MNVWEAQRLDHLERVRRLARTLPPDAAISHWSAAVVHDYPLYSLDFPVKVTRTRGRGVRTSDVHVHVAQLRPQDRTFVDGVPVTSGARTVVDLSRRLLFRQSLVVADGALRRTVTRSALNDVLLHQWHWPGIFNAILTARHADGRAESALESVVRSRFIELGLPMPQLQVNIRDRQNLWIARVDFDLPQFGLVGEADGRIKYTDHELWAEKLREELLEDAGREVIRWRWAQAHASDQEFAGRVWRYIRRAQHFQALPPHEPDRLAR